VNATTRHFNSKESVQIPNCSHPPQPSFLGVQGGGLLLLFFSCGDPAIAEWVHCSCLHPVSHQLQIDNSLIQAIGRGVTLFPSTFPIGRYLRHNGGSAWSPIYNLQYNPPRPNVQAKSARVFGLQPWESLGGNLIVAGFWLTPQSLTDKTTRGQ
jgi:hypothetical protein